MPVSTRKFAYDKATHTFIAEVAELGPNPWCRPYNDAIDMGIELISARTGHCATFVVNAEVRSEDGDIMYWMLIPLGITLARLNTIPSDTTMIIYND